MSPRIRLGTLRDDEALAELQVGNRAFLRPWEPVRGDAYFTGAGQRAELEAALARHNRGEEFPLVVLDDSGQVAGRLKLSNIMRGPFQSCSNESSPRQVSSSTDSRPITCRSPANGKTI